MIMNQQELRILRSKMVGRKLHSPSDRPLGTVTAVESEDNRIWATIDNNYDVDVTSVVEVCNLSTGAHYYQLKLHGSSRSTSYC